MRVFQNFGIYPSYRPRFKRLVAEGGDFSFVGRRQAFLNDRFGATHLLEPVINGDTDAFFTVGDEEDLQRQWAKEQGLSSELSIEEILLAQIEAHRTEVFYNLNPTRFPSTFIRRLPGCVKHSIGWRAAPSGTTDFTAYNLMVCNFEGILNEFRKSGCRAAYFAPSFDPVMEQYASTSSRTTDVLFVGSYSRHHRQRAKLLERVANQKDLNIAMHLDRSRLTRLAESPIGYLLPLKKHRRPAPIRQVAREPLFGLELYRALGNARIVINAAIDMAGQDRGNMRCFESLGCGCLLISDAGVYPAGMATGETMLTFEDEDQLIDQIQTAIANWQQFSPIAQAGHEMIRAEYSKHKQFQKFKTLCE